jgi:hypothetical protein
MAAHVRDRPVRRPAHARGFDPKQRSLLAATPASPKGARRALRVDSGAACRGATCGPKKFGRGAALLQALQAFLRHRAQLGLRAVASIDGVDPRDLSFSADVTRDDGDSPWMLRSLGLVGAPAMSNVGRVHTVEARDLASLDEATILLLDREQPFIAGLLCRARTAVRVRRAGAPLVIDGQRSADVPRVSGWIDPSGRPVPGPSLRRGPSSPVLGVR